MHSKKKKKVFNPTVVTFFIFVNTEDCIVHEKKKKKKKKKLGEGGGQIHLKRELLLANFNFPFQIRYVHNWHAYFFHFNFSCLYYHY